MIKCLLTFINRALFIISIIRTDKIDNAEKGKTYSSTGFPSLSVILPSIIKYASPALKASTKCRVSFIR